MVSSVIRGEIDNRPNPAVVFDLALYFTEQKVWYTNIAKKLQLHKAYIQHWKVHNPLDSYSAIGEFRIIVVGNYPSLLAHPIIESKIRDSGGYFNSMHLFVSRQEMLTHLRRLTNVVRAYTPDKNNVSRRSGLEYLETFRYLKDSMRQERWT